MEVLDYIKKYKYHLFIAINLLWIWALISPNIYYFDDNYRAAGGFYNWGGDFRPFSDWLYYILGMGRNFTDLTPLPQLFALGFIYYTYFLYIKKFSAEKITIPVLLTFLPIVWSPFLLSNLYFRYDSIFMLLAVLLSVLAAFNVDNNKNFRAVVLLFVACGFYQPAIVAYVCTALFFVYFIKNDDKNKMFNLWLKQSLTYFIIFLSGIALYYFTIMKFTTDYNFYSATHSQMSIQNLIPNIIKVIQEVGVIFKGDTGSIFFAIFSYLILINLIFLVKKFSYLGVIIFFTIQLGFIFSATGVNLLLETPYFWYRTLIFYGFYISYLLLSSLYFFKLENFKKYSYTILFFVSFYFLSIALSASSAQKNKKQFESNLMINIIEDVYNSNYNANQKIIFYGEYNPYIIHQIFLKYPVLEGVISDPIYYTYKLQNYFPYQVNSKRFRNNYEKYNYFKKNKNSYILLKDSMFYKFYKNESEIVIYFKSVETN